MKHLIFTAVALAALAGCDVPTAAPQTEGLAAPVGSERAVSNFRSVVARVEPIAESICRQRTRRVNCNFVILVDEREDQPPNAFQTLNRDGRPLIGFTTALIEDARNTDELAFILGHEVAHHIEGHIAQAQSSATAGALIGGVLGSLVGLDAEGLRTAQNIGGTVGARRFSKEFELEADALGTIIAARSGYDPVRGAAYFQRVPDPGDRFLGTHPPNADRIATVRRTAAGI